MARILGEYREPGKGCLWRGRSPSETLFFREKIAQDAKKLKRTPGLWVKKNPKEAVTAYLAQPSAQKYLGNGRLVFTQPAKS